MRHGRSTWCSKWSYSFRPTRSTRCSARREAGASGLLDPRGVPQGERQEPLAYSIHEVFRKARGGSLWPTRSTRCSARREAGASGLLDPRGVPQGERREPLAYSIHEVFRKARGGSLWPTRSTRCSARREAGASGLLDPLKCSARLWRQGASRSVARDGAAIPRGAQPYLSQSVDPEFHFRLYNALPLRQPRLSEPALVSRDSYRPGKPHQDRF